MEETYQTIKIRNSNEYTVSTMEYPFQQMELFYIKFIVFNQNYEPERFLIVQPQDVVERVYEWTQDEEDKLIKASKIATQQREDYQKAIEEEMARRAKENPPEPKCEINDDGEPLNIPVPAAPGKYDQMWG